MASVGLMSSFVGKDGSLARSQGFGGMFLARRVHNLVESRSGFLRIACKGEGWSDKIVHLNAITDGSSARLSVGPSSREAVYES